MPKDTTPIKPERLAIVTTIMKAMNVIDFSVPIPEVEPGDSLIRRLANLDIGESLSKAELCDTNQTVGQLSLYSSEQVQKLRNKLNSSVREAAAMTGYEYFTETATMMTHSHNFYHVVIVSRVS